MKLLEATKWKEWPMGGVKSQVNLQMAFETIILRGVKEIELTDEEYLSFVISYSQQIPAEAHVVDWDFYFWGVHITKIKE